MASVALPSPQSITKSVHEVDVSMLNGASAALQLYHVGLDVAIPSLSMTS